MILSLVVLFGLFYLILLIWELKNRNIRIGGEITRFTVWKWFNNNLTVIFRSLRLIILYFLLTNILDRLLKIIDTWITLILIIINKLVLLKLSLGYLLRNIMIILNLICRRGLDNLLKVLIISLNCLWGLYYWNYFLLDNLLFYRICIRL